MTEPDDNTIEVHYVDGPLAGQSCRVALDPLTSEPPQFPDDDPFYELDTRLTGTTIEWVYRFTGRSTDVLRRAA